DDGRSALHLFPVSFDLDHIGLSKRQIFSHYRKRGVALQVHYTPLYELPVFASLEANKGDTYPGVDRISPGLVSLPLFMGLTEAEQELVISITLDLLGGSSPVPALVRCRAPGAAMWQRRQAGLSRVGRRAWSDPVLRSGGCRRPPWLPPVSSRGGPVPLPPACGAWRRHQAARQQRQAPPFRQ